MPKKIIFSKIDVRFIQKHCDLLFAHRKNSQVSSRMRFKIQDVMDAYEEWRDTFERMHPSTDKMSQASSNAPKYRKKTKTEEKGKAPAQRTIGGLIGQLGAGAKEEFDFTEQDQQAFEHAQIEQEAQKIINRKVSVNRENEIGLDLQKYNDKKPSVDQRVSFSLILAQNNELLLRVPGDWRERAAGS